MIKRTVVTVDFDKTLTRPHVQDFVRYLIFLGADVRILTYRYDDENHFRYEGLYGDTGNTDIWELAAELNISQTNVVFTNCCLKSEYLNKVGDVLLHIDDDFRVMCDLRSNTKVIPIQVKSASFRQKVLRLLKEEFIKRDYVINYGCES